MCLKSTHNICLYGKIEKIIPELVSNTYSSLVQLDAPSNWRPGGRGFNPRRGWQHSFVEIDHEVFSAVILSLPLIQEGQLSVSVKECAQYWLTPLRTKPAQ